jgi:hypothetical protein
VLPCAALQQTQSTQKLINQKIGKNKKTAICRQADSCFVFFCIQLLFGCIKKYNGLLLRVFVLLFLQ